jgi:2-oxoglutarate dehydrogenase E2 component (dihydrolipoamide succinyltransferase)
MGTVVTDSPLNPTSGSPNPKAAIPVPLPDLGTAGQPVRVSAWFVEVGDPVEAGEPILEVVTPGITCDVCAPAAGRVDRIIKDLDAPVLPGEVVAWVDPCNRIRE